MRVRPQLRDEVTQEIAWLWDGNVITQARSNLGPSISSRSAADTHSRDAYQFDHLFSPEHSNAEIYADAVHPIVGRVMQGLHGSIFAYGQTSRFFIFYSKFHSAIFHHFLLFNVTHIHSFIHETSGKTFTMNGSAKHPGIIPQTIYDCFEYIKTMTDREFLFRVSYLEIYNETINDLLNPQPVQIKVMHDPKLGTVLAGVKEQIVMTAEQVIALLQGGEAHRHVGSTDMNEKSSRAHTLFRLIVESKDRNEKTTPKAKPGAKAGSRGGIRVSTLNLVSSLYCA